MRLLLERRGRSTASLNATPMERFKVLLAGLGTAGVLLALVLGDATMALVAVALLGLVCMLNAPTLLWFLRERGLAFAIAVTPLQLVYYAGNAVAAGVGLLLHVGTRPAALREVTR